VGAPRHRRASSAWSSPPASSRPGQQGDGAAWLQWSREARVRDTGDCGIDRGQGVETAGAHTMSTACAATRCGLLCRRGKRGRLHCDATWSTSSPVHRTQVASAGERAGEPAEDWRSKA
jgi:hypothetical protein